MTWRTQRENQEKSSGDLKNSAFTTIYLSESLTNDFEINPHQNDQGQKGPCCFQRPNALKCLKGR